MESFNKVKTNFCRFLCLAVVSVIIGNIGAIACGIGVVITFPIQICILTVAFRDVFNGVESVATSEEAVGADTDTGNETGHPE